LKCARCCRPAPYFASCLCRYYGYKDGEDRRTADAHHNIDLPLLSFLTGISIDVVIQRKELCPICNGTGARNPESIKKCPACHGAKSYSSFRKTIGNTTQSHTKLCPVCDGSGIVHQEPCSHCGGAKLIDGKPSVKVALKPGTPEGHPFRFEGMAEQRYESITGDVVLHVFSEKHPVFGREGAHLIMHRNITLMEALLGFEFTVTNIDGSSVTVSRQEVCPPDEKGECTHEEFGKGLPIFSKPDERGSLKVILHIIMPEKVALSNSSKSTMEKANKAHKKALRKLSRTVLYNGTADDDEGERPRHKLSSMLFIAHVVRDAFGQTATAQTARWRLL
jgi:DnaJ-related protein SCJ1